jgi:hypothetical protein
VHARLGHGAGNGHVADHGLAREAAAPASNAAGVSTVANCLPGAIDDLAATVITPSNDGRLRIDTHGVAGKSVAFGAKNNYVADFPPNKSD